WPAPAAWSPSARSSIRCPPGTPISARTPSKSTSIACASAWKARAPVSRRSAGSATCWTPTRRERLAPARAPSRPAGASFHAGYSLPRFRHAVGRALEPAARLAGALPRAAAAAADPAAGGAGPARHLGHQPQARYGGLDARGLLLADGDRPGRAGGGVRRRHRARRALGAAVGEPPLRRDPPAFHRRHAAARS